jgi:starvation-inducible DNA-binding protein
MPVSTFARLIEHETHPAFSANQELADHLQELHVDLIDLHLQAKQLHWNVVGKNFRDLHRQLDEIVDAARGFSDEIAERMRSLYITPDGRAQTVAAKSSLPALPTDEIDTAETVDLIVAALYATAGTARRIHDAVDAADPTTADILHSILASLEQFAWMVGAENRVANATQPRPIHE